MIKKLLMTIMLLPLTIQAQTVEFKVKAPFDEETEKITVSHPEIAQLDMPAMTMKYHVKKEDQEFFKRLKKGDTFKAVASKTDGKYTLSVEKQ